MTNEDLTPSSDLTPLPIIDIHVHVGGAQPDKTGCIMSDQQIKKILAETPFLMAWQLRFARKLGILDAQIKKRMIQFITEASVLDRVVVLPLDGIYDKNGDFDFKRTNFYVPNDYVLALRVQCPKIIPAASINPLRRDWDHELDRCLASGARLVKWLAPSQDFDPADPRVMPFYRKLAEKNLPLLSHTGYEHTIMTAGPQAQAYGEPWRLKNALEAGVTVIMAHSGTSGPGEPDYWEDFLEMARIYPNLYGDTAAFTHWTRAGMLPKILNHDWAHERLVHGSDATLQPSLDQLKNMVPKNVLQKLMTIGNPIIKDFELKKALGFPKEIFTRAAKILRLAGL